MPVDNFVFELAQYALNKKGAQLEYGGDLNLNDPAPCIKIPGISWGHFFDVNSAKLVTARLPVKPDRLESIQEKHPSIAKSSWAERDGHVYMEIPLNGIVPQDEIKSFIDDAYNIVWNKTDERDRKIFEILDAPLEGKELVDQMIDLFSLEHSRDAIHGLIKNALLLRTISTNDSDIPLGATKIGGLPDLPQESDWPLFSYSSPLAFLAQINLAEVAPHQTNLVGLPSEGLLSLFSVWGWVTEDEADPQTPNADWLEQNGWTVFIHTTDTASLKRMSAPEGLYLFKAASVERIPVLSLPNHQMEPEVMRLNWSEEIFDMYDEFQSRYRSVVMARLMKNKDSFASHHLLGGYALFQQEYPEELEGLNLSMLLQIGSDINTEMCWGDGGELTFYVDTVSLDEGKFEKPWGTCQCG